MLLLVVPYSFTCPQAIVLSVLLLTCTKYLLKVLCNLCCSILGEIFTLGREFGIPYKKSETYNLSPVCEKII